jgi:hypothetical protein
MLLLLLADLAVLPGAESDINVLKGDIPQQDSRVLWKVAYMLEKLPQLHSTASIAHSVSNLTHSQQEWEGRGW